MPVLFRFNYPSVGNFWYIIYLECRRFVRLGNTSDTLSPGHTILWESGSLHISFKLSPVHSSTSSNHCLAGLPPDPFLYIVQPLSCWPSSWSIPLHHPTTVLLAFLLIHSSTSSNYCLAGLPPDPFLYIVQPLSCWPSSWSIPLHRPTTVLLAFLLIHSSTSSNHCLAGLPPDPFLYIVQPLSCWPSSWSIPLHRPTTVLLAFLLIHSSTSGADMWIWCALPERSMTLCPRGVLSM